jgi:hypothetical protein
MITEREEVSLKGLKSMREEIKVVKQSASSAR